MALNEDLKIMYDAGLFSSGIVKGGVDKQNVAKEIRKLREKKDKKGIEKYIETLKSQRAIDKANSDPKATEALSKLVNDQSLQIANLTKALEKQGELIQQLTEKPADETTKGNADNNGGQK